MQTVFVTRAANRRVAAYRLSVFARCETRVESCERAGERFSIYADLFAKKDEVTIDEAELGLFRTLVPSYAAVSAAQLQPLHAKKSLVEICHDQHPEAQERLLRCNPRCGNSMPPVSRR
jgi:hypothetical protein